MLLAASGALAAEEGQALYRENCAACHGADRLGGQGPALIPESLERLRKDKAAETIANGREGTQMPAFGQMTPADIGALTSYIYAPLPGAPVWGEAEIGASRVLTPSTGPEEKPVFKGDPLNLFVVVEAGDHHATIMDGDKFEPLHRFKTRYALHGGPKFTADGRYVFFSSRDGWITKFDLWRLQIVAEARAGLNTRNIAMSSDGKYLAAANYLPNTIAILNAGDLSVARVFQVKSAGGNSSRISAIYQAPGRKSFIAALKDAPEIWEISTDPNAKPIAQGFVHSHEQGMIEALPMQQGLFTLRRMDIEEPLDDFFFDPSYRNLLGSSRSGGQILVVNINTGQTAAHIAVGGLPHLGAGISWIYRGHRVLAVPHLKESFVTIIDMSDWSVVKRIATEGPGFFLRSHENSRYAWVDTFMGQKKDLMHVIDKETLEIVKTLQPEKGKTAAHVEFDKTGAHAVVSIWDMKGALVIYDAKTLEEVKRIPMVKPAGKYNVANKIGFSEGTSH
ncbi:MAG: cytochrome D1 domain-containing protein [Rhodomicrobium sp.]